MVLITTNERLSSMHEAVTRPGRCASLLEFEPLSAEAAPQWLTARGKPLLAGHKPRTLAELYVGADQAMTTPIGFAPDDVAA
jgi:hypothetical protein